jgi:tetratricopeptide (TPR) repeat protein
VLALATALPTQAQVAGSTSATSATSATGRDPADSALDSAAVAPLGAPATETPAPIAAAPAPAALADAVAQPSTSLSATDAFSEFRRRFDAADYPAAVPYAQRVLDLAEKDAQAPDAEEVQVAQMNLATTQYLAADYVAAESSYRRAIELVESSGRPLHARLARAYAGLASAYHDSDRHDLAVQNFEQAVGLTRRHEGLLADQQVPLLEKYVDSLTELGRYEDALRGQRYILRIATRKHGGNDVALAPTLENIGRWYAQVGAYDQARRVLKRSIELIEIGDGPNSLKLLSPLSALASCNRKQLLDPTQQLFDKQDPERAAMFHEPGVISPTYSPAILLAEAEKSLLRAVTIAEDRPDPSPFQVADARTQLGDWYQGRGQHERALPNYSTAWLAAVRATDRKVQGKPLTEALFGKPVLLQVVRPDGWRKYAERPPEQIVIKNVLVEFTVNALGAVESARVLDDTGDPKRAEKVIDSLKGTARYRPRMANGEPVATTGVTFSQPWVVLVAPEEGEASPDGKAAPDKTAAAAGRPAAEKPARSAASAGSAS